MRWESVSVGWEVVCWTDGCWRLGDGVSWRMTGRRRMVVVSSDILQVDHRLVVDKLGGTGGTEDRHGLASFIEDGGVVTSTIHCVFYGLKSTVGKSDVINSRSSRSVAVLRVSELVSAVVVFHGIGESVIFVLETKIFTEHKMKKSNHQIQFPLKTVVNLVGCGQFNILCKKLPSFICSHILHNWHFKFLSVPLSWKDKNYHKHACY